MGKFYTAIEKTQENKKEHMFIQNKKDNIEAILTFINCIIVCTKNVFHIFRMINGNMITHINNILFNWDC